MISKIFRSLNNSLQQEDTKMPALFIGHGSPMNGIEHNEFSATWSTLAQDIPHPKAVIVISAHWNTRGTRVTAMNEPRTIHDFGGFPQALFDVQYPAPGDPSLAAELTGLEALNIVADHDWGLDHGTWTIMRHMFPQATVPVLQISIDYTKAPAYHFQLASELQYLRKRGVLIVGSGNMVHNLRMISWPMIHGGGYDWALELNDKFKRSIQKRDMESLIHFERLGPEVKLGIPTAEHYLPLLYIMGLSKHDEDIFLFNDKTVGGSLTMTSLKIG